MALVSGVGSALSTSSRMPDIGSWCTQVPGFARAVAAQAAGVPEDAVDVHVTLLGGGFGRRLEVDVVGQAVRVALETQPAPVQLTWSREEDLRRDFYRPAAAARFEAALDERGRVTALSVGTAGDAILPRYYERVFPLMAAPVDLPDKTTAEGLFDLAYDLPHQRMAHVATHSGVPVGFWRSVGHSHNAFFSESFIDEMAQAAKADPVAFRLALLIERDSAEDVAVVCDRARLHAQFGDARLGPAIGAARPRRAPGEDDPRRRKAAGELRDGGEPFHALAEAHGSCLISHLSDVVFQSRFDLVKIEIVIFDSSIGVDFF